MREQVPKEFNEIDEAVQSIRDGDKNAFAIIIQAYHVQIRAMIGAKLIDTHNADDIAQQTFVFAFQNLEQYKLGTNCLAWLKAIARNKVLSHIKKCSQSNKHLQSYRKQTILNKSSALVNQSEFDKRLNALAHCIEQLPESQRNFLKRVNNRDTTLAELAKILERSSTAVRKQTSRLYATLRNCIMKNLNPEDGS